MLMLLAEMFGYAKQYAEVPGSIADSIIDNTAN